MVTNTSLNVLPIQREQDLKKSERKESLKIDYRRDKNITDFGKAT